MQVAVTLGQTVLTLSALVRARQVAAVDHEVSNPYLSPRKPVPTLKALISARQVAADDREVSLLLTLTLSKSVLTLKAASCHACAAGGSGRPGGDRAAGHVRRGGRRRGAPGGGRRAAAPGALPRRPHPAADLLRACAHHAGESRLRARSAPALVCLERKIPVVRTFQLCAVSDRPKVGHSLLRRPMVCCPQRVQVSSVP